MDRHLRKFQFGATERTGQTNVLSHQQGGPYGFQNLRLENQNENVHRRNASRRTRFETRRHVRMALACPSGKVQRVGVYPYGLVSKKIIEDRCLGTCPALDHTTKCVSVQRTTAQGDRRKRKQQVFEPWRQNPPRNKNAEKYISRGAPDRSDRRRGDV